MMNNLNRVAASALILGSLIISSVVGGTSANEPGQEERKTVPPSSAKSASRPEPSPSPQSQNKTVDARQRQQAFLRYIEAQRLKGEAQRQRSARLLDDAIKAYKDTI